MRRIYIYFVAYQSMKEGSSGCGNTQVELLDPITSFGQITAITEALAKQGGFSSVVITFYKLMLVREEASDA